MPIKSLFNFGAVHSLAMMYGGPEGSTQMQKPQHKYQSHNTSHKPERKLRRAGSEQRSGPGGQTDRDDVSETLVLSR